MERGFGFLVARCVFDPAFLYLNALPRRAVACGAMSRYKFKFHFNIRELSSQAMLTAAGVGLTALHRTTELLEIHAMEKMSYLGYLMDASNNCDASQIGIAP